MAAPTPCGLSFNRTLEIIKENVLNGNYNGRSEVMAGLLRDGFTYAEARQVTDQYFKIYSRVSNQQKNLKPNIILSPKEKLSKRLNNIAVDYLNGNIQGFPMTDADTKALEAIYEKHAKADTPTLKEKYNEEASVFVQKFLPNYSNELFKSSVYARPLLSAVFFIKSLTSNLHAQIERSITDSIWDGKRADFTWLKKFGELANQSFVNVLKGGVPATSLYQSEANVGTNKGRLEEFSIKDTEASSNPLKSKYYAAMKFMTKWSNRLNAAPDTRGIFSNAERHFYQLLKEKYRGLGMSNNEAQQEALKAMELDDKATATKMAELKFKELGLPIKSGNGKNTTEFNVAVAEYQRRHRNEDVWGRALMLSKNDFWKRNMTVASELGFGDYGLFGLKAQALSGLRDKLEKHKKTKALSAFNLYAFGFLNGAANFAEDALERVPLYGAIKLAFLQARKGNVTDSGLQDDISRRQRDIIVKNITTAMFFIVAKMIEKQFCPDYAGKQGTGEISEGRTQIGVCGIPLLVPPQMMATYKMYKIIDEATDNDEDFLATALNVLPVLVQSNQVGLGGGLDKLGTNSANWAVAKAQGNQVRADEEKDKLVKQVIRMGADVGNSFLPIPSRVLNEAATVTQRVRGINQKQQDLPFAIDEFGDKKGMLNTLGKVTISSIGNVTGISEIIIAATGAKKEYAVDWQGRKVVQFRGSDITGSGIQYTKADDILATAGVKAPYVNRLEKVSDGKEKEKVKGFSGKTINKETKKVRYLTDEEYFNVSVALGQFNKEYFEKNGENIVKLVEGDKTTARKEFKRVFGNTKKRAIEAVGEGKDTVEEILNYVKKNWESKTVRKISSTEINN